MNALRISALLLLAALALPLLAQETFTPYIAQVTGDSVRVRSGAGLAYPPVCVAAKGDELTVVGNKDGWAVIELPADAPCWISAKFVTATNDGKTWQVTGNKVNLRVSADTKYYPVGQAAKGDELTPVVGEDGKPVSENGYVKVAPPGNAHGAISLKFVNKLKDVDKTAKAETKAAEPKKDPAGTTDDEAPVVNDKPKADKPAEAKTEVKKEEPKHKPTAAELEDERKTFHELENMLNDELKKPADEVNLTGIRKMFEQFVEFSLDKEIGERARLYIDKIDRTVKLIDAENERLAKLKAERKAKIEHISKQATEQPKKDEPKGPVKYVAEGTVGSTGKTALTPASHRLYDKDGNVLYDLRWDKGDLAKLMGSKVGVVGKIKQYDGWPYKVIVIERIDVLSKGESK